MSTIKTVAELRDDVDRARDAYLDSDKATRDDKHQAWYAAYDAWWLMNGAVYGSRSPESDNL